MSVRPHPTKGPGWWQIDYYPGKASEGRQRIAFEGTWGKAVEADHTLRKSRRPAPAALQPRINEVVPEFADSYKLDHQPRGYERLLTSLRVLLPFFGNMQFHHISPAEIDRYKSERLKTVKPTTIQKELCALSSLCKWAHERGYGPRVEIKKFPPKMIRAPLPSIPPREEVLAVLAAIPDNARGPFLAMYYAGLRKSEACDLRAEDVMGDSIIVRGKGNKQRVVPLIEPLRSEVLRRAGEVVRGLLWPLEDGRPRKEAAGVLIRAAKRAGVNRHYHPHLLRHCFATHGLAAGVSLRGLQGIMGHSTSQVTEGYAHLAADYLRAEMAKIEAVTSAVTEKG